MKVLIFIKSRVQAPFPYAFGWKEAWRRALFFGLFVSLFLGYFKPFELDTLPTISKLWMTAFMFGTVTFLTLLFNIAILPQLWKNFFQESTWTLGKEALFITYNFLLIGLVNFGYFNILVDLNPDYWWTIFSRLMIGTIAVGITPAIALLFYDQNRQLKKNLLEAQRLSASMRQEPNRPSFEPELDKVLAFKAENGKLEKQIPINDFLYLKAAGNYLDVYYYEHKQVSKFVLRNRLKNVAGILDDTNVYQCHRSYLVNLDKVVSVSGNARGLELILENLSDAIPVARGKSQELTNKLEQEKD